MKRKFLPLALAAALFMTACNDESADSSETNTESKTTVEKPATEEEKTEISVGPNGAAVSTKGGTDVKLGQEGATVGTKDVNIKLGKDTTDQ